VAAIGVPPQKRRKAGQGGRAALLGKYVGEIEAAAQAGDWRLARSRLGVLATFYQNETPASFDGAAAQALVKDFEYRDRLLKTAAPFPPPVGGTAQRRGQVIDILARLSAETMPGAARQLTDIQLGATGSRRTLASYSHYAGTMALAKITIGAGTFDQNYLANEDSGWFTKSGLSDIAERLIAHEYAHHLEHLLNVEDPDRRARMYREIAAELGGDGDGSDPTAWVAKNKATIIVKVGTYASKDEGELVAELFAEWWGKRENASPAAQVVGRYFGRADTGPEVNAAQAPPAPGEENATPGTPEPGGPADIPDEEVSAGDEQTGQRGGPGELAGAGAGRAGQPGQG
jgi:hypothetical protein